MQYIIDFVDTVTEAEIASYMKANKCAIVKTFSALDQVYLVSATQKPKPADIVSSIIDDAAEPMVLLDYQPAPGDEYPKLSFSTNDDKEWWKIASYGQPNYEAETQTYERRGQTATVYIVDSGVDASHPDLADAAITHLYTFTDNTNDTNGHGTALASLIAGKECGVTDANIVSVKIFQDGVPTLQSHFLDAINEILLDVSANSNTFPIVNMSWGIAKNAYIEQKINLLIDAGVFVVAAAGNNGIPIENVTPASIERVITVGAYNEMLVPSDFSNYTGPLSTTEAETNYGALDVWAPGENIRVALVGGSYGLGGGTSLSAGIVSAAIAYNSNFYVLEDGTVPATLFRNSDVLSFASAKDGVLTLEGKYAESINRVACIRGEYDGQHNVNYATISKFYMYNESGTMIQKLMFNQLIVESYEIEQPLPDGITIDANGWIQGTMEVTEPFYWESNLTYTKRNGYVKQAKMGIAFVPVGTNAADLPQDNPVVQYSQYACNSMQYSSPPRYYYCSGNCLGSDSGFCHDACNAGETKDAWAIYCACRESFCP